MRPKATLEELRKRFEEKPSSKSVYTVGGIAYTVVSLPEKRTLTR